MRLEATAITVGWRPSSPHKTPHIPSTRLTARSKDATGGSPLLPFASPAIGPSLKKPRCSRRHVPSGCVSAKDEQLGTEAVPSMALPVGARATWQTHAEYVVIHPDVGRQNQAFPRTMFLIFHLSCLVRFVQSGGSLQDVVVGSDPKGRTYTQMLSVVDSSLLQQFSH